MLLPISHLPWSDPDETDETPMNNASGSVFPLDPARRVHSIFRSTDAASSFVLQISAVQKLVNPAKRGFRSLLPAVHTDP